MAYEGKRIGYLGIMADLPSLAAGQPATYTELNRWIGSTAVAVNPDHLRLSIAQAIPGTDPRCRTDEVVTGVVLDLLRRELVKSA